MWGKIFRILLKENLNFYNLKEFGHLSYKCPKKVLGERESNRFLTRMILF